jgi:hypothetical protein
MALAFLLDENLRGPLWNAILRHNTTGLDVLDATRVGDPSDLPLGSVDADILSWCERNGRILVSEDKHTLSGNLANHLAAQGHVPGILIVRPRSSIQSVLGMLVLIAHAGDPVDYRDRIDFVP